ncbi:hypothetical protein ACIA8C_04075 [Nocardia sp. NPDC051321]|uniref:hypothetical protein n=1 Tax=Nocardia sp. NPDC051321 TaxID=3364323 RepID=UPI0037BDCADA
MADAERLDDWADNPRLNTWLAEQEAAFPEWAQRHEGTWDFTPASLDRLAEIVQERFTTYEEAKAAEHDPFCTVAAWYLGEVQVRHCGTVWHCRPHPGADVDEPDDPFVIVPDDPEDSDDEPDLDDDYQPLCVPISELQALFLRGIDNELRDVLSRYDPKPSIPD